MPRQPPVGGSDESPVRALRPPENRTHLGRFVQTVLDGGGWDVVSRKAAQNLGIVTSAPIQLLLPFVAVAVGVVLAHPRRWRLRGVASCPSPSTNQSDLIAS